jgi:hypothetical protein
LGRRALGAKDFAYWQIGPMQTLLTIVGIILLIAGIVFMGQGSGYFPYPASSFMISQTRWIYYGAGIAVVGLVLIILARR